MIGRGGSEEGVKSHLLHPAEWRTPPSPEIHAGCAGGGRTWGSLEASKPSKQSEKEGRTLKEMNSCVWCLIA